MLDEALAERIAKVQLTQSAPDSASFPFWRELVGDGPPGSAQEAMYETELAQIVLASKTPALVKAWQAVASGHSLGQQDRDSLIANLKAQPISQALRTRLN